MRSWESRGAGVRELSSHNPGVSSSDGSSKILDNELVGVSCYCYSSVLLLRDWTRLGYVGALFPFRPTDT